ncbi:MAG: desulfoferrodoxin [Chloroflexota bacterium]
MPNKLGKRLQCEECGAQLLVTKGGEGEVRCCDKPMKEIAPKALPSAD